MMIWQKGTRSLAVATVLVLCGCSANRSDDTTGLFPEAFEKTQAIATREKLSGTVIIDGSSTVYPISQAMVRGFQKDYPEVQITVNVSGTGGGFKKFCDNQTDVTGASRPINLQEMQLCQENKVEYIELPIAFDGLAVVTNIENKFVDCLKVSELKKIWEPVAEGKITSWNQIRSDFPNQPLKLYAPDRQSGTYDYFTLAVVGEEGKSRQDYIASKNDTALVEGISSSTETLGYFGYAYYLANRDRLKLIAVDSGSGCVQPSPQAIADSSYQPLSRPIFIYVKKASADRSEVKAFINFYVSPSNANLILEVGDVPLPNITLRAAIARFNRGRVGTQFGGRGAIIGVEKQNL
jgi:phosphate transport system substrate-binding protein